MTVRPGMQSADEGPTASLAPRQSFDGKSAAGEDSYFPRMAPPALAAKGYGQEIHRVAAAHGFYTKSSPSQPFRRAFAAEGVPAAHAGHKD